MTTPEGAIVAGVDGSDEALEAVRWAAEEATSRKLPLHLVHAFNPSAAFYGLPVPQSFYDDVERPGGGVLSGAVKTALGVDADLVTTADMPPEAPARVLIEASRRAHMVVLGASGRG